MVISPTIGEGIGGTEYRIAEMIPTDKVVVPVTKCNNYKFNTELLNHKEAVICDYVEYGWNASLEETDNHFFGYNTDSFKEHFPGEEWDKFDKWVEGLEKCIYFKRELVKGYNPISAYPIDYPNWINKWPLHSEEEFNKRHIMAFNFFGRSHEARLLCHASLWVGASHYGYSLCDNLYHYSQFMQEEKGSKVVSLWQPHYCRVDLSNMLSISYFSKTSFAHPGAGRKTFREHEVSTNSVLICHENNLEYAYPWINGVNCIKFKNFGEELPTMIEAQTNPNLYSIYKAGVENAEKYRADNYTNNYLLPIINKA